MMKKNIKIILVILIISFIIFISYNKKTHYDKYAVVEIDNLIFNFDTLNQNSIVNYKFKIINSSNNPFFFSEVKASEKTNFLNTRTKKIIHPKDSTFIYTQNTLDQKGQYLNNIILESNSVDKIVLKIEGFVK